MARHLLESLRGIGAIHAGDVLLRATHYDLSVWSNDDSPLGAKPSGEEIDGHIDITGIAELAVLAGPDALVLTIEDGRRLAFRLTNSGGGIVSGGWLSD